MKNEKEKEKTPHILESKKHFSGHQIIIRLCNSAAFFNIYLFIAVSKTSCFAHRVQLFEFIESGQNNHIKH